MGPEMDAGRLGGSGEGIKVVVCSDPHTPTPQLLPVLLIPSPINMSRCHVNGCKWTPRRAAFAATGLRDTSSEVPGPFPPHPGLGILLGSSGIMCQQRESDFQISNQ